MGAILQFGRRELAIRNLRNRGSGGCRQSDIDSNIRNGYVVLRRRILAGIDAPAHFCRRCNR